MIKLYYDFDVDIDYFMLLCTISYLNKTMDNTGPSFMKYRDFVVTAITRHFLYTSHSKQ